VPTTRATYRRTSPWPFQLHGHSYAVRDGALVALTPEYRSGARDVPTCVRVQGINGIMAVMGHRSARMALYYTQEAKKSTLTDAAMTAWEQADKRAEAA
jgi:hypothetical protein